MKQPSFESFSFNQFPRDTQPTYGSSLILNPGSLTDIHRKCRDIQPIWLEGAHFGYKHYYSPNTILLLKWVLSHTTPTGVRVGTLYSPMIEKTLLRTPLIHMDLNPSTMTFNCAIQYQPFSALRFEFTQQLEAAVPCIADNVLRCDFIGKTFTGTLHGYNIQRDSGRIILSYLQNLTSKLAVGAEFNTDWPVKPKLANTAFAIRYSPENTSISATVSPQAFDIMYWRLINANLQLGTSVVYNEWNRSAVASIFYQWLFPDATVRGLLGSDGSVGFTYNRRLHDFCCNVGFSVLLCVPTNKFVCGFKFDFETNNDSTML